MFFISLSNPLYNTVLVFLSIMALIYIIKPEAVYDRNKKEFRQFGTDDGKTLMPIYVIAILIAIILYVLFNQIARMVHPIESEEISEPRTGSNRPTDKESDISSLKSQMALMNQNIAQLHQMNQFNQMSQIQQINNQLANLQMSHKQHLTNSSGSSSRSRRSNIRGYDTSGIYRNRSVASDGSDGSDRSIMSRSVKSLDADNIVNSVLASARPSVSYNSHSRSAIYNNTDRSESGNRAILPNTFSI